MQIKTLLITILFLSFFAAILPASLSTCIPDGCNFNQPTCGNNSCVNETIGQHLDERAWFSNVIVKFPQLFILAALLILFIAVKNFLTDQKILAIQQYFRHILRRHPEIKLFNPLIEAFSNGILHPKIY